MRDLLAAVRIMVVAIIAVTIMSVIVSQFLDVTGDTRTSVGTVRMVRGSAIQIETADGEIWSAYAEGFRVGDEAKVVFKTNHTPCLVDDEIAAVVR